MKKHFRLFMVCIGILLAGSGLYNHAWAQDIDLAVENPAEAQAVSRTSVSLGLGPGIAPE